MKEMFEETKIEVIEFSMEDIITASDCMSYVDCGCKDMVGPIC